MKHTGTSYVYNTPICVQESIHVLGKHCKTLGNQDVLILIF